MLTKPVSFGDLSPLIQFNEQSDDYTLVLTDANKQINMTKGTATTLTVPTNAAVAFEIGTVIIVAQQGAGQVTVAGAGPPTINSANGDLSLSAQYSTAVLIKEDTDVWTLSGDLSTP